MKTFNKKNIRYNILSILIYVIGIVIILKLFIIQIINGQDYLKKSNDRLTREMTIKASRGNILDRNGTILAGTKLKYSVEVYKTKISDRQLNDTILEVINVLEKNGDTYFDEFPITIEPISFTFTTEEKTKKWLENKKLDVQLNAEDVLNAFLKKYKLEEYQIYDARKIIGVRYRNWRKRIYKYEILYYFW